MIYKIIHKYKKLYSKPDKSSSGNWAFVFLILVYSILLLFVSLIGKIGLGINILACLFLYGVKLSSKELYYRKSITFVFVSALLLGNTLFLYSLFDNYIIAFSISLALGSGSLLLVSGSSED